MTSFSRSWRNLTEPPPNIASSESAMPATTKVEMTSTSRFQASTISVQAMGGPEE